MQKLTEAGLHPEQMLVDLPAFMARIMTLASELGLSLEQYQADHIALRVNDRELAEALHQAWLAYGEEWSTNIINGRPIIVIGFHQPIQVGNFFVLPMLHPAAALHRGTLKSAVEEDFRFLKRTLETDLEPEPRPEQIDLF